MPKFPFCICLLLLSAFPFQAASADHVSDCLKGRSKSNTCQTMIANYWAHHQTIERIARQEGVEPALLKALIAYESNYNHKAVSPKQASGLTQVMPTTARGLNIDPAKLFVPEVSVRTGARYLRRMFDQFGRTDLALAAYNAGPGRVIKAGYRVPPIAETQNYVSNVSALFREFKNRERNNPTANRTGRKTVVVSATPEIRVKQRLPSVPTPTNPIFPIRTEPATADTSHNCF